VCEKPYNDDLLDSCSFIQGLENNTS
jgi:hypothetical protein